MNMLLRSSVYINNILSINLKFGHENTNTNSSTYIYNGNRMKIDQILIFAYNKSCR